MLATVSDKKIQHSTDGTTIDYYNADMVTAQDYYPGGMQMPGRKYSIANANYRYGFNGKELDTEDPVQYDYGFRIYDPRLGRFKSVDPLFREFPWNSSYAFAENDVIRCIDIDGGEKYIVTGTIWKGSDGKWLINITTKTLPKPGPLGSGALYDFKIDNYRYIDIQRKGDSESSMRHIYIPLQ